MRLLGYHVNAVKGGIPELIATSKPAAVVVLDGDATWSWVIDSCPGTKFLWRGYRVHEPDFNSEIDPIAAGRAYAMESVARMGGVKWDYVLGPNEPIINNENAMKRLAAFEVERARVLREHGYGAAIGTFSVGNPADMSLLQHFLPAIEAIHEYRGVLSLHEYGFPYDLSKDAPWYILRHRKFYDGEPSQGWYGLPEKYKKTPLIITETGGDQLIYSSIPAGSLAYLSPEEYIRQLEWLDEELVKDDYVIGSAIYCCGNISEEWVTYDVWRDTALKINDALNPLYRKPQYNDEPDVQGDALGLDVSYAQARPIDWNVIRASGRVYVFVRSSYRLKQDVRFTKHYSNAKKAGLLVGMYHFLYDTPSPYEQGRFFGNLVKQHKPNLPPTVDVEIPPRNEGTASAEDVKQFIRGYKSVCSRQLYVYTNIYSWHRIMKGNFDVVTKENLGLFVADWGDVNSPRLPKPWKNWEFWQYAVVDRIPGYNGRIDLGKFNGDYTLLLAMYGAGSGVC